MEDPDVCCIAFQMYIYTNLLFSNMADSPAINHWSQNQNACPLADEFEWNFFNKNFSILIQISLKFVPKGTISNKSAFI